MGYKLLALLFLVAALPLGISNALSVVNCNNFFSSSASISPAGKLAPITSPGAGISSVGNSLIGISMLIILAMLMIAGVAYSIGQAFHLDPLINFSKAEMLEGGGNLAIIAVVGIAMAFAPASLSFFSNLATFSSGTGSVSSGTGSINTMYVNLCNDINTNVITASLENWFGIFVNLMITNVFATSSPPTGGFKLSIMPNNFGIAVDPFQGVALLTQLLWDEQTTYFGGMFLGMFMIVILFIIYYLFPLFLYIGIALRSFPWTRPAGGSLIALFIAFYIIFPALMFPFLGISGHGLSGKGFCESSTFNATYSNICNAGSFLTTSGKEIFGLLNYDFGNIYYENVFAFIQGLQFIGIDLVGLIIALIVSYEMVEKIGTILGAPSLQGARMLGRVV